MGSITGELLFEIFETGRAWTDLSGDRSVPLQPDSREAQSAVHGLTSANHTFTGQTLHEIFREADSELTTSWNALTPYDRDVYETVATALKGTYFPAIQQPSTQALTGEVLFHMNREIIEPCAITWEQIGPGMQMFYNGMANRINQRYLAPLQGLVMQWRQLLQEHDELSVMSILEIDDWKKHWELLKRRSVELLGEEKG